MLNNIFFGIIWPNNIVSKLFEKINHYYYYFFLERDKLYIHVASLKDEFALSLIHWEKDKWIIYLCIDKKKKKLGGKAGEVVQENRI